MRAPPQLLVSMFGFDLIFLLTRFANPVVFAVNERVVVNPFTIIFNTKIAFHADHSNTANIRIEVPPSYRGERSCP